MREDAYKFNCSRGRGTGRDDTRHYVTRILLSWNSLGFAAIRSVKTHAHSNGNITVKSKFRQLFLRCPYSLSIVIVLWRNGNLSGQTLSSPNTKSKRLLSGINKKNGVVYASNNLLGVIHSTQQSNMDTAVVLLFLDLYLWLFILRHWINSERHSATNGANIVQARQDVEEMGSAPLSATTCSVCFLCLCVYGCYCMRHVYELSFVKLSLG